VPLLDRNGWKAEDFSRGELRNGQGRIVPAAELAQELAGPSERIGVELPNDFKVDTLRPVQARLALIAIAFPSFTDGRGFSLARALRAQGYRGRLRAVGHLIPDQFAFALECGFDEVEIDDARAARQPIEQWLDALCVFQCAYQRVPGRASIFEQRRAA